MRCYQLKCCQFHIVGWAGRRSWLTPNPESHRHHMCLSNLIRIMIKPPLTSSRTVNGVVQELIAQVLGYYSLVAISARLPISDEGFVLLVSENWSTHNVRE